MTFAYWCILIACLLPLFCAAYAKKAGGFRFKDNGNAEQSTINTLAGLFILFRLAFIWCYIADKAALRSLMWAGGFACTVGLFVAAA